MRIQSKFKDYYDAGMAHGLDEALTFRRFPREIKATLPYTNQRRYGDGGSLLASYHLIGFCGRMYPAVVINLPNSIGMLFKEDRATRKVCYKVEDIDVWVKEHFDDSTFNEYMSGEVPANYNRRLWRGPPRCDFYGQATGAILRRNFRNPIGFFTRAETERDRYRDLFEKEYTPIIVPGEPREVKTKYGWGGWERPWIANGSLKEWEFFRVFDPFMAFQEISQFMGSLAEPRKPMPHIDDETMAEIKGFNKKTSFRKDPSPKKKARRH